MPVIKYINRKYNIMAMNTFHADDECLRMGNVFMDQWLTAGEILQ